MSYPSKPPIAQPLCIFKSPSRKRLTKLDECFGKLKLVIIIADDIVVVGDKPDHSDHNQAFINQLQIAQKCNVKLNYDVPQYKQDEVNFFGETYTTSSHQPSKSKVSAITAMPSPSNKKQVQSFIGMVNYLSKFSLRLSELAEPIIELSKDKVPFNWGPEHQAAFTQMKFQVLPYWHVTTPRSKPCCRQMQV